MVQRDTFPQCQRKLTMFRVVLRTGNQPPVIGHKICILVYICILLVLYLQESYMDQTSETLSS